MVHIFGQQPVPPTAAAGERTLEGRIGGPSVADLIHEQALGNYSKYMEVNQEAQQNFFALCATFGIPPNQRVLAFYIQALATGFTSGVLSFKNGVEQHQAEAMKRGHDTEGEPGSEVRDTPIAGI